MPLEQGYSKEAISKNIGELISSGRSKAKAAAIAFSVAKKAAKKAGKTMPKKKKKTSDVARVLSKMKKEDMS